MLAHCQTPIVLLKVTTQRLLLMLCPLVQF